MLIKLILFISFGFYFVGCAREPHFKQHEVGKVFTLLPAKDKISKSVDLKKFKAIHFTFGWGGRLLDIEKENPMIKFTSSDGRKSKEILWSKLFSAYKSECSNDLITTLDGPLKGQALVCDHSMDDISQYSFVEAITVKGKKRRATSWSLYRISEDVMGVSINLY